MSIKFDFSDGDYYCFSSDLDWAPETAIDRMLSFFRERSITPTIFKTHDSMSVRKNCDVSNIGIHPNFIQPSSHGNDIDEIIDNCCLLAPESDFFRCHRWYSSNDIYDRFIKRGFKFESNICTNLNVVAPFEHRSGMISFPVFMEDGAYIIHNYDLEFATVRDMFMKKGLKVINIHPMHFALNTPYFKYTRDIKDSVSRIEWNTMDDLVIQKLEYKGRGIRDFLTELCDHAVEHADRIITLREAYEMTV